jgi:hypothetical protein
MTEARPLESGLRFLPVSVTALRDVLARGWSRRGRRRALFAGIGHSLDLSTWESLARRQGMPEAEAVELLVAMVRCP